MKPSKNAIIARNFAGIGEQSIGVALTLDRTDSNRQLPREVIVEPLTGRDEAQLTGGSRQWSLPAWVTRLLGDKVVSRGRPIGAEAAARLPVVDRDLLILHLRMLTFGREIWGLTRCPRATCKVKLDFTFDLASLELPPDHEKGPTSGRVANAAGSLDFSFRQPDGLDQEAIAELVFSDPYLAWLTLMSRCIVRWEGQDSLTAEKLGELPRDLLQELDQIMAAKTASLDWDIEFTCDECGRRFVKVLDIQSYFWQELQFSSRDIFEEVHRLAYFYHWSETDILSLTRWKRRLYLGFINQQRQTQ